MDKRLSVSGFVPDDAPYTPRMYDPHHFARETARREDQRLVRVVADAAGLPFPVTVLSRPDLHVLEVRVPGHALATLTREYAASVSDPDTMAVYVGLMARRAWFRTPALPVPDNVELGDN